MNERLPLTAILLAVVLILTSQTVGLPRSNRQSDVAPQVLSLVDGKDYVGNVAGVVMDTETGTPLEGAEIVLVDKPLKKSTEQFPSAVQSNKGFIVEPEEAVTSPLRTVTDANGEFLINSVPTPNPSKDYSVIAYLAGYDKAMLDQIPVLPGASMSLEVRFSLTKGKGQASVFDRNDKEAPFNYHHEKQRFSKRALSVASAVSGSILATREGLVGHTTANGHLIQARDHFVALPSGRSLAPNGSYAFQVTISANGRTTTAPVWDVGPWNTRDDYWSPSSSRQMWNDLQQMLPEAQAAFYNHYNGGHDEFGRSPTNGAGIDIADGTFWDDLGLTGNSWVNVQYLWTNTPPAGPRPVVSSSLTLSSPGPYYVGQYIYGYFTITNRGSQPITFQRLLIGGRLNGDQSCAGGCPDFSSANYVTLQAGQAYGYSGYQYLSRPGSYSFFVAYQRMDGGWITSVDADAGVRVSLGITVQNNAQPALYGQSPTYVYSSWFPQAITLYGQQLSNTSAMYIQFPNGTSTYIYPPFQIYSRSYNQLSFLLTFNTRGWHYMWAYTPTGGWSNTYSLWVN